MLSHFNDPNIEQSGWIFTFPKLNLHEKKFVVDATATIISACLVFYRSGGTSQKTLKGKSEINLEITIVINLGS